MANHISILHPQRQEDILNYLSHNLVRLENIYEAIRDQEVHDRYLRRKGNVALSGAGAGNDEVPLPQGYDWILERIAVTAASGGVVFINVGSLQPIDIVEAVTIPTSGTYSDGFNNNIYVPQGSSVFVQFASAGNNGAGLYNLQCRAIKTAQQPAHNGHFTGEQ